MTTSQKILVLMDGSERSRETLKYITEVEPLREKEIVLFHVYSEIPEYYWDLDQDPQHPNALPGFDAWQKEKLARVNTFMKEGKRYLTDAGLDADRIHIRVHPREVGVARDVLEEAQTGYAAVVLRRRGMGYLKEVVLGSVSSKLLSKLPEVPVLLAGKKPVTNKVLIGVDGSDSAERAVDFVGAQLGGFDYHAEMIHVIRGITTLSPGSPEYIPPEIFDVMKKEGEKQLQRLKDRLVAAGFAADHVSGKILSGVESRAEAIVNEAETNGIDTIVIGRKGLSRIQDFFLGRVSHKIIHSGRDFTVWIT
ncbi:MAG: universal stress protein [Desulfosudaceae bacterium]